MLHVNGITELTKLQAHVLKPPGSHGPQIKLHTSRQSFELKYGPEAYVAGGDVWL
mgnify:CR=1 FL=1